MKISFEYGDVVELDECQSPRVLTIFGELKAPADNSITYVGGDNATFGLPLPSRHLRKIGVDIAAADKCRARYVAKAPNGLKELEA